MPRSPEARARRRGRARRLTVVALTAVAFTPMLLAADAGFVDDYGAGLITLPLAGVNGVADRLSASGLPGSVLWGCWALATTTALLLLAFARRRAGHMAWAAWGITTVALTRMTYDGETAAAAAVALLLWWIGPATAADYLRRSHS
ncbi:hypothetical protein AB0I28_32865 [Phytomonospora sp. NPDC050363]|uniref:hypothetical protein n=1 Tax=Phytomonospora sp. NPDC050363 TaxID=3155642 RepID=UPI0033F7D1AA